MSQPSPFVDTDRVITAHEHAALVTVETMDRLVTRAYKAIDAGDPKLAVALLGAASGVASARMSTAVKDQLTSDAIAADAAAIVRGVLDRL